MVYRPKTDWKLLESRFLRKEWMTLTQMAEATGVNYNALSRHAVKGQWLKRRDKIETAVDERATEIIIQTQAEKVVEMHERHIKIARFLQGKALARLQGKDPATGKPYNFERDEVALTALRLGVAVEQAAVTGGKINPTPGGPDGPAVPAGSTTINVTQNNVAFIKELSHEQLMQIAGLGLEEGKDGSHHAPAGLPGAAGQEKGRK